MKTALEIFVITYTWLMIIGFFALLLFFMTRKEINTKKWKF